MRKIVLKELGTKGDEDYLSYSNAIRGLLRAPTQPNKGLSVEDIRSNIKVLDALDAQKNNILLLEEAEYLVLKNAVYAGSYIRADHNILQFIDDVDHAEAFKVEDKEAEKNKQTDGKRGNKK